MERVFISGIGLATCVGNDPEQFWNSLTRGICGLDRLRLYDPSDQPVKIGGEVRGLDLDSVRTNECVSVKRMDRNSQFAVYAANQALQDAGLSRKLTGSRTAIILGCALGGLVTFETMERRLVRKGTSAVSPFLIPMVMSNAPAANISLAFGVTGASYAVSSACASSGHAMIDALDQLRLGRADVVLTGGAEAGLTSLGIASFCNMRAMCRTHNDDPKHAMRPFDRNRSGFIMSEGAVVLVFETETHLRGRGGTAWAELLSGASSSDAFNIVKPEPTGQRASQAVVQALEMAQLQPDEIAEQTYVSAHGTSTSYNDPMETAVLKTVFGASASRLRISSIKSMTGHMIGAACAAEMAACCFALDTGVLPPTINYETPDPACDLNYIPNHATTADIRFAVNNTFGFGGHNVSLIAGQIEDDDIRRQGSFGNGKERSSNTVDNSESAHKPASSSATADSSPGLGAVELLCRR